MTDSDRKFPRPSGLDQKKTDPLMELTHLFDFNAPKNDGPDFDIPGVDDVPVSPPVSQKNDEDDFDLSFLDSKLETSFAEELDFLDAEHKDSPPRKNVDDSAFNELYDAPSFSPRLSSTSPSIEPPFGFEESNQKADIFAPKPQPTDFGQFQSVKSYDWSHQSYSSPSQTTPTHAPVSSSNFQGLEEVTAENSFGDFAPSPQHDVSTATQNHAQVQSSYTEPEFDEIDFDSELENLLIEPLSSLEDEPGFANERPGYAAQPVFEAAPSIEKNTIEEPIIEQFYDEPHSQPDYNSSKANGANDFDEGDDPFGFDNLFATTPAPEGRYDEPVAAREEEYTPFTETTSLPLSHEPAFETVSNEAKFEQPEQFEQPVQFEQPQRFEQTEQYFEPIQQKYSEEPSLSEQNQDTAFEDELTKALDQFEAENNTHEMHIASYDDNGAPEVDSYRFADEIVETTEAIDVPDIAYQEERVTETMDSLEKEFADVFDVGNTAQTSSAQSEQEAFFEDAYRQSGYEQPNPDYGDNEQTQGQYPFAVNAGYADQDQYGWTGNAAAMAGAVHAAPNHFKKKATITGLALLVLIIGGFIAYQFIGNESYEQGSGVIHADNTPTKVQPKPSDTDSTSSNNQDVYNHASGNTNGQQGEQSALVDGAEAPEDLSALNEQAPESSESLVNPSNIEDAITSASNQTIPTREIQTVIVNPDGTIVPAKAQSTVEENSQAANNQNTTTKAPQAEQTPANQPNDINGLIADSNNTVPDTAQPPTQVPTAPQAPAQNNVETVSPSSPANTKPAASPVTTTVGAGGYYVQLASQPTEALAKSSMNNAKSKFGSVIGSLPLSIQTATIPGKGTYYRVRVQVGPKENAQNLCEKIKSSGGNCFIAR